MPLKIYTDHKYLPPECMPITLLEPLWPGKSFEQHTHKNLQVHRLDMYRQQFAALFEVTDIAQADIAIFPAPWELAHAANGAQYLAAMCARAKQYHIKVVVFCNGDVLPPIPLDGVEIFHTALRASTHQPHEHAMPALIEDVWGTWLGGSCFVREWQSQPSIGFCGTAFPLGIAPGLQWAKEWLRYGLYRLGVLQHLPRWLAYAPRAYALRTLLRSSQLTTQFTFRAESPVRWAYGYLLHKGTHNAAGHRNEYFNNICHSDYVLCVRGYGNYSIRLYETLCMGRIPVMVDTGVVLPFEDQIPWRELCVWVPEADIPRIEEIILAFHARHRGAAFVQLQQQCRQVWQQWLSPEGFFAHLHLPLGLSR